MGFRKIQGCLDHVMTLSLPRVSEEGIRVPSLYDPEGRMEPKSELSGKKTDPKNKKARPSLSEAASKGSYP